ncbi:hypothetical protein HRR83_003135 [Exophiala dermatitidis]|uniref:BTB domain-containing protein n=1 Tax=Exophiala dermatitidis TaxID=5970 RepID=A0AAN6IR57_EXODE|nr:hypothetical protein HRR75_007548 [Exophiala dermatitidis]KAJ4506323.1 hypothetical protein HRR73_008121 [Exophiala dermatitidis]KAJ4506904.1 hypothetical protein HRR74_008220 [Exophiala dermatitidis]KAJ4547905.1 hypothetical protein HRR76_000526 [Exophiala dermatitidis]KAJ4553846.1 hypothetical protein HRR77_002216 [Exophiala dermatitidis]
MSAVEQFANFLEDDTVQVRIRGEERIWHVHRQVLVDGSPYLTRQLADHPQPATQRLFLVDTPPAPQRLVLDDTTNSEGFNTILFWLYQARLPEPEAGATEELDQFNRTIRRLMNFTLQAEKFELNDAAKTAALDQILDLARLRKGTVFLAPSVVAAILSAKLMGGPLNPLHDMILDIACFEYRPSWHLSEWYVHEITRLSSSEDCSIFLAHYARWTVLCEVQADFPFSFFPSTPVKQEIRYRTGFLGDVPPYE